MGLSAEMVSYIKTGHCPCCHEEILSPAHVSQHSDDLRTTALSLLGDLGDPDKEPDRPGPGSGLLEKFIHSALSTLETAVVLNYKAKLVPDTAKALWLGQRQIQCQTCMNSWDIGTPLITSRPQGSPASERPLPPSAAQAVPPPTAPASTPSVVPPIVTPVVPRKVDLTGCDLVAVTGAKQVEIPVEESRKRYQNNSKSTVTKEITITNSITSGVTIDSSQLRSYDVDTGVTVAGFASIQGKVTKQLSTHYSVMLQGTFDVTEKTSIDIPPYSTIEHVIRWKVISWVGAALLGKSYSQPVAQIPYQVPLRLTYDDTFVDAPEERKRRRRR